jgi:cytochrome c oxidase subunit II
MKSLIIIISIALILGILYMIFRVGNLMGIAKGRKADERVGSDNKVHAVLFVLFMISSLALFFWYSFENFDRYQLPVASEHGVKTDSLFWITMAITVIAFVIISIVMFVFVYQYQYKEGQRAKFYPDNHRLELAWTIIPAIVLTVLIFTGLTTWNQITSPASKEAEVIELIGQQFAWTARYPGKDNQLGSYNYKLIDAVNEFGLDLGKDKSTYDDFKSLELHLPVGKEVLLKIRAKDVLHSVFIPHLRVKMDAVPGMPTQFKFIATKTTEEMRSETKNPNFNYELACTEICGRGHFSMKMAVVIEDLESYNKWKASQEAWLKQNPDYLKNVPAELKEAAMILSGIQEDTESVAAIQK